MPRIGQAVDAAEYRGYRSETGTARNQEHEGEYLSPIKEGKRVCLVVWLGFACQNRVLSSLAVRKEFRALRQLSPAQPAGPDLR